MSDAPAAKRPEAPPAKEDTAKPLFTILVVDDGPAFRRAVPRMLNKILGDRFDLKIKTAEEGKDALNQMDDVQLVISDIDMPNGMGGYDLLEALSAQGYLTPVIMMSGGTNIDTQRLTRANGFLPKPFTRDVLATMIDKILAANPGIVQQP